MGAPLVKRASPRPAPSGDAAHRPAWRRWLPIALRIVVVGAIGWWLWRRADLAALGGAVRRLDLGTLVICLLLGLANLALAGVRWRFLMRAFGAEPLPSVGLLVRLTAVGLFYNTYVPGSVGGDVVRGVVSRRNFDTAAASYLVVVFERLIGLSALAIVFLVGVIVAPPLIDLGSVAPYIGGLVLLGVAVLLAARRSGRRAPRWGQIPRIHPNAGLWTAFGISFIGHALNVTIFWAFATALGLGVGLSTLMVVAPLAFVAAVVPLAIAGIGPREAALVGLLGLAGVGESEALALSLGYAAVLLVVAGVGGVLQLLGVGLSLGSDTSRSSEADPPRG